MSGRGTGGGRKGGKGTKGSSGRGRRDLSVRVKSARGRKLSSTLWLRRQLNDPYVAAAQKDGYRSRAAYKLIQLEEKCRLLKPGDRVVDLGAAPGGWSQVAAVRVCSDDASLSNAGKKQGQVIGIDLTAIDPIPGVELIQKDFTDDDAPELLCSMLRDGQADVVLSDMAAPSTGHRQTDHARIIGLCELALDFAQDVLTPGGVFAAKVLQGGTEHELLALLKRDFTSVRHVKPEASRADSAELYVVATGFRGSGE